MSWKTGVIGLLHVVCGFLIAFFLPPMLLIALNRMHGVGHNPDGAAVAWIGWLALLLDCLLTGVLVLLDIRLVRKYGLGKHGILCLVLLFLMGAAVALVLYTARFPCGLSEKREEI